MNKETKEFESDDLDWLAFCYVAGELKAERLDAFEVMLGEDSSMGDAYRQAVVRAVDQSQLIHAAADSITHSATDEKVELASTREKKSESSWMPALVFAASLILAITAGMWALNSTGDSPVADTVSNSGSESEGLAAVWLESFEDVSLDESLAWDSPDDLEQDADGFDADWMFTALTELEDDEAPEPTYGEM